MRAVRLHGVGDLRVEDVPAPPAPGPGEVRLRVLAAGICGSDLHNFRTGQWISRAPSIAGHEFSGEVTAVGEGVDDIAPGDRVVADSRFWCGACEPCRSGRRHLCARLGFVGEVCEGGFAEEAVLPARLLVKVAADLDPVAAAMAEPLAVALHAVSRLAPAPDAPVLVVGAGTIGGLAALALSRDHRGPLLVSDRNAARARLVADVAGATPVELTAEAVAAATGGLPLRGAIEATGSTAALSALLDVVAGGGSIALVGIYHGRIDLDPTLLVEREIALLGCHAFAGELPHAAALLPGLAPALGRLVDAEIGLDEVPAAYRRLLEGRSTGLKTVIRPGAAGGGGA